MIDVLKVRRTLLLGMFLLATGSLALHFSIHSPLHSPADQAFPNSTAFLFTLLDAALVTFLFSKKETAAWGYLLNGFIVIYGTVFMTHFGWAHIHGPDTPFHRYVFHPTSPEILIAWADFCLGAVLYRLWYMD